MSRDANPEFVDVGEIYHDTYRCAGDRWRIASRVEHTTYMTGGELAALIRDATTASRSDPMPPFG